MERYNKVLTKIRSFISGDFFSTTKYSLIATISGLITNFSLNKIIAISVGPNGIAILSQFQNILNVSLSLSTAGISNGIVKLFAEKHEHNKETIITTSLTVVLISSFVVSSFLFFLSEIISSRLFGNSDYVNHIVLFSLNIPFLAINNWLIAILNGNRRIKSLVLIRVVTHFFQLFGTASLLYFYGLNLGLIGFVTVHGLVFLTTSMVLLMPYLADFKIVLFRSRVLKNLLSFSLVALISFIAAPTVETLVRTSVTNSIGLTNAGLWDALNKLSQSILSLFSLTMSVYLLPKFASIIKTDKLRSELIRGVRNIVVPLFIVLIFLNSVKGALVGLLFDESFQALVKYIPLQFAGVFFKTIGWILGYLMISRNLLRPYIFSELLFQLLSYVLCLSLLENYGFSGLVVSYIITNIIYVICMGLYIFHGPLNSRI